MTHLDFIWERIEQLIRKEEREEERAEEIFNSIYEGDYSAERGAERLKLETAIFGAKFIEWLGTRKREWNL